AYGLSPDSAYSDIDKIKEELAFAKDLYDQLGCIIINVASLSIEETASMVMNELGLEDHGYYGSEGEINDI
ncbi:MAG: kinase/pyrophosphorylase, partial [Tetragenococcus koreensis]